MDINECSGQPNGREGVGPAFGGFRPSRCAVPLWTTHPPASFWVT